MHQRRFALLQLVQSTLPVLGELCCRPLPAQEQSQRTLTQAVARLVYSDLGTIESAFLGQAVGLPGGQGWSYAGFHVAVRIGACLTSSLRFC